MSEWPGFVYREDSSATFAVLLSAVVLAVFAGVEVFERPGHRREPSGMWGPPALAAGALLVYGVIVSFPALLGGDPWRTRSFATIALAVAVLVWHWSDMATTQSRRRAVAALGIASAMLVLAFILKFRFDRDVVAPSRVFQVAFGLLVILSIAMLVSWVRYGRRWERAVVLATIATVECAMLVLMHHLPHHDPGIALRAVGVGAAAFLIAWVVTLGWTIDPNLLSLHNFYKARIVRAYLGASNQEKRDMRDISETAPGDDIPLASLTGHEKGAPLHLVNATLNLVGGRELATAQRSAAPFTMSSQLCGSPRTGYCLTRKYMDGTLTLGSAIAASGAAVSPTRGTKSVSAPLALLLALFNVRLGFWAPTPNRDRWREHQPTLWPYYLLSEALSQTSDVGTYCYLTDGGHFDNTGVYALIERGCQAIYMLDDGADPKPCFSDMGELIRRCRIDFAAEIRFDKGFDTFRDPKTGLATEHFATGTIEYDPGHLRQLGWSREEIANGKRGKILWIKPSVTQHNTVDLRQYRLENGTFPQETTLDQWYDEAQFESYRALGFQSMKRWLQSGGRAIDPAKPSSLFP